MRTSALISLIKKDASNWSSDNIRELINEVQRIILLQRPLKQLRVVDTSTGKDPVLATTAGTYEYTIDTDNGFSYDAWRVSDVYSSDIFSPSDIISYDATPSANAKFVFLSDPGSQNYYVRYYRQPTQITSASVQLEIPHQFHVSHVKEGVLGLIEKSDSGKSERWEKFERILLPDISDKLNKGQNTQYFVTPTFRGY